MANKNLFSNKRGRVAKTDTKNAAGGRAYTRDNEEALAQYALTGTFNGTLHASANSQLDTVLKLLQGADDEFVAKLAIYARAEGFMKDIPSFLVAWLAAEQSEYFEVAFESVIDNGKMLRNFVQYIRSGVLGRRSFGSRIKRAIQNWLTNRDTYGLVRAVPGNDPSLVDIVKMVHPPAGKHKAFYAWLLGKELRETSDSYSVKTRDGWRKLPKLLSEFEDFKRYDTTAPKVPFQMLTGLEMEKKHWKDIARDAKWMMTRMNLNTFKRHGVLDDKEMVRLIADRLGNKELVRKARQFPYQIFTSLFAVKGQVPSEIYEALEDALDASLENVPTFGDKKVAVCVDTSGSMQWGGPMGGSRGNCRSEIKHIDVAALFASAIIRNNRDAIVVPFDTRVHDVEDLNRRDSVWTNANKLRKYGGGGTALGSAMQFVRTQHPDTDLTIFISDNESWADRNHRYYSGGTSLAAEFDQFKKRKRDAKLVLLDIEASTNTQAKTKKDVLNVGGFSDRVFDVVKTFADGELDGEHLVTFVKATVTL